MDPAAASRRLELTGHPDSLRAWWRDLWGHREVLGTLARADFHVRYKRAAFGVAWAVAVPLVQAVVLAVVFSKLIRVPAGRGFGAYVLAGVLAWSYFSLSIAAASTAIVDGSGLTDKVWFPRVLMPLVPVLANLPGLAVSTVILVALLPLLGSSIEPQLLLLLPATALLVMFTASLGAVLAGLHVYFRDVKFLVQAVMLVWFYVTPIAYPQTFLGNLAPYADFNPMTGIVSLFHWAAVGADPQWGRAIVVSVVVTALLTVAAVESQRRHDRLFVDLL